MQRHGKDDRKAAKAEPVETASSKTHKHPLAPCAVSHCGGCVSIVVIVYVLWVFCVSLWSYGSFPWLPHQSVTHATFLVVCFSGRSLAADMAACSDPSAGSWLKCRKCHDRWESDERLRARSGNRTGARLGRGSLRRRPAPAARQCHHHHTRTQVMSSLRGRRFDVNALERRLLLRKTDAHTLHTWQRLLHTVCAL